MLHIFQENDEGNAAGVQASNQDSDSAGEKVTDIECVPDLPLLNPQDDIKVRKFPKFCCYSFVMIDHYMLKG